MLDIATLGGIILGLALLLWAILINSPLSIFLDFPSVLIVLGGTIAATLINYPLRTIINVLRVTRVAFFHKQTSPEEMIATLVSFAEKARREGLLAMEDEADRLDEPFLKKGIQLVVDGTEPELVKGILEIELSFLEERHGMGQQVFQTMGSVAPAFGMTGTLIGLIQMLGEMDDPNTIGPALAVAVITTLYGVVLANLVFLPIAGKLKVRSEEEIQLREIMIEGILSIQAGENPRIVEEKLKAFLPPENRENLETRREAEERMVPGGSA
ncbi:MAG: motility protein A [Limnochordia bacterium]|jgi:chemotaxis protein MotA